MQFTIKQARSYAGLTQEQAAKALGVCRHRYMKIEKNQGSATVAELNGISRITGIPIRDFILAPNSTNVDNSVTEREVGEERQPG